MRRKRRRRRWYDRPLKASIAELSGWRPPEIAVLPGEAREYEVRKGLGLPRAEYRVDQEPQPTEAPCE